MRFLLVVMIVASLFSCSKDNTPVAQPPFMNCKADGATIDFNQSSAVHNGSNLQISGTSTAASATISLSLNNIGLSQTGTFNIGPGNFNTASYSDDSGGYSAGTSNGSGVITITFNNGTTIEGNFQFTAVNLAAKTKVITEGRFLIYH